MSQIRARLSHIIDPIVYILMINDRFKIYFKITMKRNRKIRMTIGEEFIEISRYLKAQSQVSDNFWHLKTL